jgi:hypothetical protein
MMEGIQVDLKRLFQGATKWVLAAIGFLLLEAIVSYLARDLIGTLTGLTVISFFMGAGFLTFALFLALILEPLEWLGKSIEPDGPTLDRRLDQVCNSFLFDVFEVVIEASAPTIGAKWSEFMKAHPNASEGQRNEFWDQLRADAAKGLIETLNEEAVEDLGLATELLDLTRQIQSIQERARKQLRRFVYGSAVYYPAAVVFTALTAGSPFTIGSIVALIYLGSIPWLGYAYLGFGSQLPKLRWWRKALERLKDKDSVHMKREIEDLEAPPFPIRRRI